MRSYSCASPKARFSFDRIAAKKAPFVRAWAILCIGLMLSAGACKKKPAAPAVSDASANTPRIVYLPSFESPTDQLVQTLNSVPALDRLHTLVAPLPAAVAPVINYWKLGENNLASGRYREAAAAYKMVLKQRVNGEPIDDVLFRLALVHALPESPLKNLRKSGAFLSRILREFPRSEFALPARLILNLQADVERLGSQNSSQADKITELSEELEKLKELDLKRRRASPN